MKTIFDPITRREVTIDYVPHSSTAVMFCAGNMIKAEIPKGSRRRAQWAYTQGKLEEFGSFLDE